MAIALFKVGPSETSSFKFGELQTALFYFGQLQISFNQIWLIY